MSIILLVLLFPLVVFITLLLYLNNEGDVFFFQQRPGLNTKPFMLYKFKTMRDIYDRKGNLLPDNLRITKLGRIIRSLSLDELPQLINVLKGNMSFVGPRPLLMDYLSKYNSFQNRRHEVKPGITGLAQVNGRNLLSWEEKFNLDVKYVDNQSFFLDVKILIKTFYSVLNRKGINSGKDNTMPIFMGNND